MDCSWTHPNIGTLMDESCNQLHTNDRKNMEEEIVGDRW
jgi:hypothetical protein